MQVLSSRTFPVVVVALAVLALGACENSGNDGSSGGVACGSGECKLAASDAKFDTGFGLSVAIQDDYVAVGASTTTDNGIASGSVYVYRRDGSEWEEVQKILPDDGGPGDRFGSSVAIDGDIMAIGAETDDDANDNAGSVYVYRLVGEEWVFEQKLLAIAHATFPLAGAAGASFGASVAVSSDAPTGAVIAIGASGADNGEGAGSGLAYVFRFNDGTLMWDQDAILAPLFDATVGDFFGYSVSVDGPTVAVGSPYEDLDAENSGAVYIYVFNGTHWGLPGQPDVGFRRQKIKALRHPLACEPPGLKTDEAVRRDDAFGKSISIDDGILAIGADNSENRVKNAACGFVTPAKGNNSGKVYFYEETFPASGVWNFDESIIANDFADQAFLGRSVALNGDTIAIGARGVNDAGPLSGAAYIFKNEGGVWAQDQKIKASDAEPFDYFGESVGLSVDSAVIGAFGDNDSGPSSGAAYTYEL